VAGAVIGALAGYIFFTERGRAIRYSIEPTLEDLRRELVQFRSTMQKIAGVANEGWEMLNDTIGAVRQQSRRMPSAHQTSPF
jgi:gas vesicle protein